MDNENSPDTRGQFSPGQPSDQNMNMTNNAQNSDKPTAPAPAQKKGEEDGNLGDALRSIYQNTVEENIPSEMLDLLNRLS